MNDLDFITISTGLEVSFRVLTKVPAKAVFDWDFGDNKGSVFNELNPTYTYEQPGFYTVSLTVTDTTGYNKSVSKLIVVNNIAKTHLNDSIYNLINYYIPDSINEKMDLGEKNLYINKWQLYLQPLVNHDIPLDKYNDELYYEGLENQLIMELAVWDFLNARLYSILANMGEFISSTTSGSSQDNTDENGENGRGDRIKQITTGPTEVQFYDSVSESISSMYSTYSKALQPGGIIDELKNNLCVLAERLDIFLPFCNRLRKTIVPKVVNKRKPNKLDGPNPTYPINKK